MGENGKIWSRPWVGWEGSQFWRMGLRLETMYAWMRAWMLLSQFQNLYTPNYLDL